MRGFYCPSFSPWSLTKCRYGTFCHGLLTQDITSSHDLSENDFRRLLPRFQGENLKANLKLVHAVKKLAEAKGCTPGQVATGWALGLSESEGRPKIIPIPGASRADRVRENAKLVNLDSRGHGGDRRSSGTVRSQG